MKKLWAPLLVLSVSISAFADSPYKCKLDEMVAGSEEMEIPVNEMGDPDGDVTGYKGLTIMAEYSGPSISEQSCTLKMTLGDVESTNHRICNSNALFVLNKGKIRFQCWKP